ncbi:MAG: leucine-rich repeat protein [Oscillospiraceae bacterium]|nr:leucine-rich repeat protein [Oscillospiraceae bacterium]
MKRKLLSILIILNMILTITAVCADDSVGGQCGENAVWSYDLSTIAISGTGDMEDYQNGKEPYIKYTEEAKYISVRNGITSIGNSAFRGFYLVSAVNIGSDVTRIGDYAFSMCHSLTTIKLPDSLTEIGEYAFSHCSRLESILIPEGVSEIRARTFEHNYALKTVDIPSTVTRIDISAFEKCDALENINVSDANQSYYSLDGVLYSRENDALLLAPNGKKEIQSPGNITSIPDKAYFNNYNLSSFTVPDGVTSIGAYAFGNCLSLKNLILPEGLTTIKEYAFMDCDFVRLKIPSTVNTIGEGAFDGCSSLVELEIPEGITELPNYIFLSCTHINTLILPDTIQYIGDRAFLNCDADIYYAGSEEQWENIRKHNNSGISSKNKIHFNYKKPEINAPDDAIKVILDGRELECDVPPIIVDNRTLVPMRAIFEGLNKIVTWKQETKTVRVYNSPRSTVPELIMEVGRYDFTASIKTTERVIPLDVPAQIVQDRTMVPLRAVAEALGRDVRWDSENRIVTISEIPEGVCGYSAFWTLDDDGTLTISGKGDMYDNNFSWGDNKDRVKRVVIEEGIERIGSRAFEQLKNLESVEIPDTVKTIGNHAFFDCDSLESVTIPESVEQIDMNVFGSCNSLKYAEVKARVTELYGTFTLCGGLQSVVLPDTVEKLDLTFDFCKSLEEVNLPSSLKEIGFETFLQCDKLTAIDVPEGVITIGERAFGGCDNLEEVTLPEGLETIGEEAFCNCKALKTINIPSTVKNLDQTAFIKCYNVEITDNRVE